MAARHVSAQLALCCVPAAQNRIHYMTWQIETNKHSTASGFMASGLAATEPSWLGGCAGWLAWMGELRCTPEGLVGWLGAWMLGPKIKPPDRPVDVTSVRVDTHNLHRDDSGSRIDSVANLSVRSKNGSCSCCLWDLNLAILLNASLEHS